MNLSGDTLNASYAFCRRLSRRSGSNFYLGFLLLPQEKRWAMEALYAFMRYSDDLIDEAPQSGLNGHLESAIDQRLDRLERWRSILEIAFADLGRLSAGSIPEGESTAMFLLPALVDTVKRFNIPVEHLYAVLDGVEMDLHGCRYETFEELKLYCQRVASAVGLACIHIWGYRGQGTDRGEAVFEPAQQAGIALQLTNILRDLKADAAAYRIYLPLEDIHYCGYSVEELRNGVVNSAFQHLMTMEINRAKQFYRNGYALMDYLNHDGRRIFGIMISIYRRLLERIARRPGEVFSRPMRLNKFQRFALLAQWALLPSRMARRLKEEAQKIK